MITSDQLKNLKERTAALKKYLNIDARRIELE